MPKKVLTRREVRVKASSNKSNFIVYFSCYFVSKISIDKSEKKSFCTDRNQKGKQTKILEDFMLLLITLNQTKEKAQQKSSFLKANFCLLSNAIRESGS